MIRCTIDRSTMRSLLTPLDQPNKTCPPNTFECRVGDVTFNVPFIIPGGGWDGYRDLPGWKIEELEVFVDINGTNFSMRCQCQDTLNIVVNNKVVSSGCTCSFRINGHELAPTAEYIKPTDETRIKVKKEKIRIPITGPLPNRDPKRMFGRITQLTIQKSTLDHMRTSSNAKMSCYINNKGLYSIPLDLTAMGWYYLLPPSLGSAKEEVEVHVEEHTMTLSTICRCDQSGNVCECHFIISDTIFGTKVYRIKT